MIKFSTNLEFVTCARNGNIAKLQSQLQSDVDINSLDHEGRTALLAATEENNLEVVKWLLDQGANVDFHNPDKHTIEKTPFLHAGANGLNEILDLLIPFKPDTAIVNGYGGSALIPACERGFVETAKKILTETDVDVNLINNLGWTALLETVMLGDGTKKYQDLVQLLLENGADITIQDKNGVNALQHSINSGSIEISKLLQDHS